jgi:hypothetical protein
MVTEITKAQLLCVQLGRLKDDGRLRPQQVSLAKRANVDMACETAREARRLLGANGILVEYSAMRHMANLESVYTYEGTHDIHTLILGVRTDYVTGGSLFAAYFSRGPRQWQVPGERGHDQWQSLHGDARR